MSEPELIKLIERAKREGWTELDLSGQELTSLPAELGELHQLTALKLGWNEKTERRNYLTKMPEWIAQLTNLKILDLSDNKLAELPAWIERLEDLESLNMSGNKLIGLPKWLGCLRKLQLLALSYNDLQTLPDSLAQLDQLRHLYLRSINLSKLPEWIGHISNLQSLALSDNNLADLPEWMARLTNLESLYLRSVELMELPEWITQLTNLHLLDVSKNNLIVLPEWIGQLTNLESLNLSINKLTTLPIGMAQLTHLRSLNLSRNRLTGLPHWIGEFSNLQLLHLNDNKLTELPEEIAKLTNLQSLFLSGNKLTDLPRQMVHLSGLQSLSLSENKLTELPEWMAHLSGLQLLSLSENRLTELPRWMTQLTNLQALYLGENKLTDLPEWMVLLKGLQTLYLRNNNLTELPHWMAQFSKLQSLNLRGNNLAVLPEWITQLTSLQSLNLGENRLTELPVQVANLPDIHSLDLSGNKLTYLPNWISDLYNLKSLNLSRNMLTILPESMAQLVNLQILNLGGDYLNHNELSQLPDWMKQLTNLQLLDLSYNNLTQIPNWISELNNLQSLDLRSNDLEILPEEVKHLNSLQTLDLRSNKLISLPDWMAETQNLPRLHSLKVSRNPLILPPTELLGEALTNELKNVDIESIRSYFRQLQEAQSVRFYEAKLLIIGEGGAGKTSLANKLLNPDCQLPSEEKSTKGIDILTWRFPLPATMADDDYQVNIWDFGGQAIYFATHQFFLTKRSVYLLVADTRRQHTDFFNWLRMQESFGGESAVLLVKNRNRQLGNSFTIENLAQLRERFPNLKEIIELDLNEVPTDAGWQDLLHHVKDYLLRLDHIGQPRPATWVAVRQAIDSDSRDVIRWDEFVTLCRAQGMKGEDDIRLLGEYLHNLGDILYFHEDAVLCDYVILKPTWGLDAVYKVLDNPEIETAMGKFTRNDLRSLWNDPIYNGYHLQLLRLMENFQLCYPLEGVRDTFIAPQLLSETVPGYTWDGQENLEVRYVYPIFMPRGILSRAIVKLHRRIESQSLVWRSGVILRDDYARAELLELRGDQMIRIRVSGRIKGDLLMEIVRALDELHLGFPKLRVERRIPCNCPACSEGREPHFFALEKLRERLANRKETIECQNPPYHEVLIRGMLDEMGAWAMRGTGRGDTYNIYGDYVGKDKVGGDKIGVGDIHDSTGLAIGRKAAATVTRKDGGA